MSLNLNSPVTKVNIQWCHQCVQIQILKKAFARKSYKKLPASNRPKIPILPLNNTYFGAKTRLFPLVQNSRPGGCKSNKIPPDGWPTPRWTTLFVPSATGSGDFFPNFTKKSAFLEKYYQKTFFGSKILKKPNKTATRPPKKAAKKLQATLKATEAKKGYCSFKKATSGHTGQDVIKMKWFAPLLERLIQG